MTFSERLNAVLHFKKIKQKDLAEATGVSQSTVSSWVNGTIPTLPNLAIVAKYIGVSIQVLLGYEPIVDELLGYYNGAPRLID